MIMSGSYGPANHDPVVGTHWDGCWSTHLPCAVEVIERQQVEIDRLRTELANERASGGQVYHQQRRTIHDQQAKIELLTKPMACGHPIGCITGGEDEPDDGGTRYCAMCALEAEIERLRAAQVRSESAAG